MGFGPINDDHAIVEVVLGLTTKRPFTNDEIELVARSHDKWKNKLPRISKTQALEFVFGDVPLPPQVQMPPLSGGVVFDRVKPDGTLDWRLKVENNTIFVNCLSYTRWAEVWPQARALLSDVCELVVGKSNEISGAVLQYIDIFEWKDAPEKYDPSQALRPGSPQLLTAQRAMDHLWHSHQGWFRATKNGRSLERLHVDAVQNESGIPIIKVDTYIQLQLVELLSREKMFAGGLIDSEYDEMHERQKALLLEVVSPEMASRINLNVE